MNQKKKREQYNIHLDYFYSLKSASEATIKGTYNSTIYLSKYGKGDYSQEKFYKDLLSNEEYCLGIDDCQNFYRKIIYLVTKDNKWVFPHPIENGSAYGNIFPTNDEVEMKYIK